MKKAGKIAGLSVALLLAVSACTAPNNNSGIPTGQTTSQAALKASASDLAQAAVSYQDTETTYADSDEIASSNNSFKAKAIGIGEAAEGELAATTVVSADEAKLAAQVKVKTRTEALKKELQATGTATVNADGTVTVDSQKLKTFVKDKVQGQSANIKAKLDNAKARLEVKAEVAGDKVGGLRRKNNVVRASEVVEVTNSDGSTSKIISVEFENPRNGVKRENRVINTFSADGKLIRKEHYLTIEHNSYSRTSTRIMTFNADGTKTIDTESKTTWANGKTRELAEHRVISADGSAEGNGTVTVTANGETKTYDLNVNVTTSGDVATTASIQGNTANPDGPEEVTVTEKADGTTTLAVADEGSIETHTVDIDQTVATEITVTASAN